MNKRIRKKRGKLPLLKYHGFTVIQYNNNSIWETYIFFGRYLITMRFDVDRPPKNFIKRCIDNDKSIDHSKKLCRLIYGI